jgi:hypothetical protein
MGYYRRFPAAIPHLRVRSIVLLTRPPLALAGPYDLHALATPPAFNLSQDQTLQLKFGDVPDGGPGVYSRSVCLLARPLRSGPVSIAGLAAGGLPPVG